MPDHCLNAPDQGVTCMKRPHLMQPQSERESNLVTLFVWAPFYTGASIWQNSLIGSETFLI